MTTTANDKELLELAAKAAGIECTAVVLEGVPHRFGGGYWNPLTDDGDALRLAITLEMDMYFGDDEGTPAFYAGSSKGSWMPFKYRVEIIGPDAFAATRRAIVRVAAEIGRGME